MTEQNAPGIDRMEIHYREQLCALMDGNLPPDEARFLLRRLQHDAELGGCWERWQMIGETLRGRVAAPLPGDFSQRIAAAIAAEPAVARASAASGGGALAMPGSRWARWGGGALAASVALVALFMARQQTPSGMPDSETPAPIVAAAPASAPPARAPEPAPSEPALPDPQPAATLAVATVAVAEVPRRAAANRRASTRSQSQRAALRAARANAEAPIVAVAANAAPVSPAVSPSSAPALIASTKDPFASQAAQAVAPSRPWPSATLPQLSGSGAFSVDYAGTGAYYPFQPRVPVPASQPSGDALQDTEEAPQR